MASIGVISDTHGRLSSEAYASLVGCDYIIHAGDICSPSILRELQTIAPVYAVLGNNDFDEYGSAVGKYLHVVIEDVVFCAAHKLPDLSIKLRRDAKYKNEARHIVAIYGHTHIPKIDKDVFDLPAEYVINPGSVTRPRAGSKPSIAKIVVENAKIVEVSIEEC